MPRQPSLRAQLNQIRAWVRQGRTNAWIAHQLDISVEQLERFKRDNDLEGLEQSAGRAVDPLSVPVPEIRIEPEDEEPEDEEPEDEEPEDERPEDEELEDESEPESEQREPARSPRRGGRGGRGRAGQRGRGAPAQRDEGEERRDDRAGERERRGERSRPDDDERGERPKRRRGRRGGRRQRKIPIYEATFDHGEEGYGLWLDPAIVDNPVYAQHWAGKRAIEVRFDPETITIRRATAGRPPRPS